ncbi:MAG: hypothetical protein QOD77_1316 [Thermoplasmata archaeon]|jgi:predicted RNA binding protein YcfA (HicA-like mRNA interferase family)|nr:hypothetical protein [Thermoplasmata archaeon]
MTPASLPPTLEAAAFVRLLARAGWQVRGCRNSHHHLVHPATGRLLAVAFHQRVGRASAERALARAGVPPDAGPRTGTA